MFHPTRLPRLLLPALALTALLATPAHAQQRPGQAAADKRATAFAAAEQNIPVRDPAPPAGAQVLNYRFGPMKIQRGQNLIDIDVQKERPSQDGWIVGFRPGLVDSKTGKSPSVGEVHLHHAVWLVDQLPVFAAGEEKTRFNAPAGYGWRYTTKQSWLLNHMIHDLVGKSHTVDLTYALTFIPDSAPEAAGIKEIKTQWMDVQGLKPYPVFDTIKGSGGADKRLDYPSEAPKAYAADGKVRNKWTVDRDATLVSTAGHLHPGGLWNDLNITRDGRTVRLFRSRANYFEPSGAVSWDVSMSATGPNWKVAIKKGDVLSTSATYDTSKASWYEVMGIMVVGITKEADGGVDPFTGEVDQTDYLTHGRLPENIEPKAASKVDRRYHDALRLRPGPFRTRVKISSFSYRPGDLSLRGRDGAPPAVRQGQQLTFVNEDRPLGVRFHTITACKAPCNRGSGIKYPLADGAGLFDSGQLGFGPTMPAALVGESGGDTLITPVVATPAPKEKCADGGPTGLVNSIKSGCVGRASWKTPKNLDAGTYTYFCRIHPYMRGAFAVVPRKKVKG